MGLRRAVCFQLRTAQVDGLRYNDMFVTGGKKTQRRVGPCERRLWLNHWTSCDLKAAMLAPAKPTMFSNRMKRMEDTDN